VTLRLDPWHDQAAYAEPRHCVSAASPRELLRGCFFGPKIFLAMQYKKLCYHSRPPYQEQNASKDELSNKYMRADTTDSLPQWPNGAAYLPRPMDRADARELNRRSQVAH